jgi:hypothetical protein
MTPPESILQRKRLLKFYIVGVLAIVHLLLTFRWVNWISTASNSVTSIHIPFRLMEIMVGGPVLAKELSPADLFIEDSYLNKDLVNPWIHQMDDSHCRNESVRKGFVITISSVTNNRLSHVGGTGHWYHLLQTILPSIKEAHDRIWGENARKKVLSLDSTAYDDVYIVFHEAKSVEDLNSFTRFCLGMVLGGGKFKRIHYGYADTAVISSDFASLVDLQVLFTADFEKQSLSELFVTSKIYEGYRKNKPSSTTSLRNSERTCFQHFLNVQLMAPRRQFMWFLTPSKKILFKKAYSQQCKLSTSSPAVVDIKRENERQVGLLALQKEMEDELELKYSKARLSIKNTNDELLNLPNDDIETVANAADRELLLDSSSVNPFRSGLTLSKAFVASDRLPSSNNKTIRNLVVYQRDSTRRFVNEHEVMKVLQHDLRENVYSYNSNGTSAVSAPWNVQLVIHDRNRPPCDLVNIMQSTTALLTTHGFQSTLLLFLPDESVLAEIHTSSAFFPHHFGQLQLAFRQRFGDKRSFLAEESAPNGVTGRLLEIFFGSSCETYKFCRSLAKTQDVTASRGFLSRFAIFLNAHFFVVNS